MRLPATRAQVWGTCPADALRTILTRDVTIREVVKECGIPESDKPDIPYGERVLTDFGRLAGGRHILPESRVTTRISFSAGRPNAVDVCWEPRPDNPNTQTARGGHLTIHVNM